MGNCCMNSKHATREISYAGEGLKAKNFGTEASDPFQSNLECPFCLELIPIFDCITLLCGHQFCKKCGEKYVKSWILTTSETSIPCPCGSYTDSMQETCPSFSDLELSLILDSKTFNIFQQRRLELVVSLDDTLHFCKTPDCTYIVCWSSEVEDGPPRLDCPQCKKIRCIRCGCEPYHEGISCKEAQDMFKKSNPVDGLELNNIEFKICKKCKAGIIKESGCDKMKCRCGYKFCYRCETENATCKCTPEYHGFWDNIQQTGDFT